MKNPLAAVLLALWALVPAQAQDVAAERQRIAAERAALDARFEAEEKACYAKFGVTACLDAARQWRDAAVDGLRRQQVVLADSERKRRAGERLRASDERVAAQRERAADGRRERALAAQQEREARAAQKAGKRPGPDPAAVAPAQQAQQPMARGPATPARPPRAAKAVAGPQIGDDEAARNREAFEVRREAARAHKAQVLERNAQRVKPPAAPLPPPAP